VRDEAQPAPRDADELCDVLQSLVVSRPRADWDAWFDTLLADGRATTVATSEGRLWLAAELRLAVEAMFPGARIEPDVALPDAVTKRGAPSEDEAALMAVRGHLDVAGPVRLHDLASAVGLRPVRVEQALAQLEGEGFALRGMFDPALRGEGGQEGEGEQFCARHLLARIHIHTQERLRREIEPVSAQDFMRFLLRWQHVAPGTHREGRRGVLSAIEQLQGFEIAAGAWEESVLPARVANYKPEWLDQLCLSGEVVWGRAGLRTASAVPAGATENGDGVQASEGRGGAVPSRATPISLAVRDDLPWLLAAARGELTTARPGPGAAADLLEALETRGALFHSELATLTSRLPVEVEEGLWDLVARGLVTADGFDSLRSLLGARERWARRRDTKTRRRLRRGARGRASADGRWALLPPADSSADPDDLAEAVAEQLLARWGVVFRDVVARETLAVPWRDVLWALRRMEARGTVRGGRFVTGFVGEQYALPGAVDALRRTRRLERDGEEVCVSGVDPLNFVGILTPGSKVPAVRTQRVVFRDGLPARAEPAVAAAGGPRHWRGS
jgi:ATP-dependent Lhr-like helicase